MHIRHATAADWPAIWPFFRQIAKARETYPYDPDIDEAAARAMWMLLQPPARTVVAVDNHDTVLGTANMYPNRQGPGAHIATASFMVDPAHARRGIGRALGTDAVAWARAERYHGMQFNAVVETNTAAVELWKSLGFQVLTTVPEAFHHPTHGYVGLHLMFQRL